LIGKLIADSHVADIRPVVIVKFENEDFVTLFRTEFWRQQKPMYARKRDRMLMQQKWANKATRIDDPTIFILKNLEEIDQC